MILSRPILVAMKREERRKRWSRKNPQVFVKKKLKKRIENVVCVKGSLPPRHVIEVR
jgi:hypothetical protein